MKAKIAISAVLVFTGLAIAGVYFLRPSSSASVEAPSSALLKPITSDELRAQVKARNSRVVLINFWASWCEPCKKEFPGILSVREKLKSKGFDVVFVSIDEPADFQAAEDFLRERGVDFQTFYKGYGQLNLVNDLYPKWEGAVPTSLLMDSHLQIVDAWEGDASREEFEQRVLAHLKGT